MLKGVKIENNTVFVKKDAPFDWEKADSDTISQLEDLLKKTEQISYKPEDVKEEVIFTTDVGMGSVKGFKDEDGDIVYTFEKEKSKDFTVIDEDFEFGLTSNYCAAEDKKQVNYWCTSPTSISSNTTKPERSKENVTRSGVKNSEGNKSKDLRSAINKKNESTAVKKSSSSSKPLSSAKETNNSVSKRRLDDERGNKKQKTSSFKIDPKFIINSKIIYPPINKPKYVFTKRTSFYKPAGTIALENMLQSFKKVQGSNKVTKADTLSSISFIKKNKTDKLIRKDGRVYTSNARHDSLKKIQSSPFAIGYLNEVKIKKQKSDDDLEFEKLLNDVIGKSK